METDRKTQSVLFYRAKTLLDQKRYQEALGCCSCLASANQNNPEIQFLIGVIRESMGEPMAALANFARAEDLLFFDDGDFKDRAEMALFLAQHRVSCHSQLGNYEKAQEIVGEYDAKERQYWKEIEEDR